MNTIINYFAIINGDIKIARANVAISVVKCNVVEIKSEMYGLLFNLIQLLLKVFEIKNGIIFNAVI